MEEIKSWFSFKVKKDDAKLRLEHIVTEKNIDLSRSYASLIIKSGNIFVNGKNKKPGYRVKTGDCISGIIPYKEPLYFLPEKIDFDILFEDSDILVINKPAGLVVHPAPGNWTGTLVNGLLYISTDICKDKDYKDIRPGIVHRLDKDTSGVLVTAKNESALSNLLLQFKQRIVKKKYLAYVYGNFQDNRGIIDFPLGRDPKNRKKMSIYSKKKKLLIPYGLLKNSTEELLF